MSILDLVDYRRRVFELYRQIREQGADVFETFKAERDNLFRTHPQSALDEIQKAVFTGLDYYPYDPAFCVTIPINTDVEPEVIDMTLGDDGSFRMRRIASVQFT
ncbi:MAG TPA: hypothetical protein VJZ27_09375, partial [Aggregatilineales bacterium]|nr:hypothetical protein [Aggregatilineales bacterium]